MREVSDFDVILVVGLHESVCVCVCVRMSMLVPNYEH